MGASLLSQNVNQLSKSDLLDRADQFIFSTGLNDGTSKLCKANMKYGLAQFHLIQENMDLNQKQHSFLHQKKLFQGIYIDGIQD